MTNPKFPLDCVRDRHPPRENPKSQIQNPKERDKGSGRRILIVAGEASGDKHAARLIIELRRRDPSIEIVAAGGGEMRTAGAKLLHDLAGMAVLGSVEVLKSYRMLRRIFYSLLDFIEREHPDAVVLVDYPGFNIRLAKKIRKRGGATRVIYYISPQVWAWGIRRKRTIERCVDRMIVILPFEKEFYADTRMPVSYVGHPLLDGLRVEVSREECRRRWGVGEPERLIALLPGSRWNEVRRHLPIMVASAGRIAAAVPGAKFVTCETPGAFKPFADAALKRGPVNVVVAGESVYDVINASDLVIVASGTATLETACLGTPMLIIYKVAWPTYFLARALVKLPYIGLVNVIAGRKVVPEFIQRHATPARIAGAAIGLLNDKTAYAAAVGELRAIRVKVGDAGASMRAADAVVEELQQPRTAGR